MKLQTLKDLYAHELKALYSAEKRILVALPKMVKVTVTRNSPPPSKRASRTNPRAG
jgi:ferritin-like metal-binding protein YciE